MATTSRAAAEPSPLGGDWRAPLAPPRRQSVVIVDDYVDIRELVALRLRMVPGVEVVGRGSNGAEALDLARLLAPDLMTIDLRMPVMGGVEAIPLLRAVAPHMRILVYSADDEVPELSEGSRPDAVVVKGGNLQAFVDAVLRLLDQEAKDLVTVDLGRLPVPVAVAAFDSWVGLHARVREAITTRGDVSHELLGDRPVRASDLFCLMGVFMQFAGPLVTANAAHTADVDLEFQVRRDSGAAARRALLALGGNGTLRAFNQAWSHHPEPGAAEALDLVDRLLVEQLPVS